MWAIYRFRRARKRSTLTKNKSHQPWNAPASVLSAAGVTLGRDYLEPIVDHAAARLRALDAWQSIRR